VLDRIQKRFFKKQPNPEQKEPSDSSHGTNPSATLQTKPLREIQNPETEPGSTPKVAAGMTETLLLSAAYGHSVGIQRDHNEDAVFTFTTYLVSDTRHIPFGLYIVADGMGGHRNGEVASAIAIRSVSSHILRKLYLPLLSNSGQAPDESLQEIMQQGVLEAHKLIVQKAVGGGTTLTAVLIVGEQMTIAHVGDSRVYLIEDSASAQPLTRDHSLVGRLEELGQITPEEAAVHPSRNVLYRALGQGDPLDPDIISAPLPKTGHLLLCSDGLWGVVELAQVAEIVSSASSLEAACRQLVQAANDGGGPDNISAILVQVPSR
jgi:PPM family protein phosphatase